MSSTDHPEHPEQREHPGSPLEHWESRYGAAEALWSGAVNATLAEALGDLTPGRSIDLGCGEGGDVLWLAERGWDALGLDLSPTAIKRARRAAEQRGLVRARFEQCDLSTWAPSPRSADLVTASFFQSEVALDRIGILRRATAALVPQGLLVIVSHATAPTWAAAPDHEHEHEHHGSTLLTAHEEWEALQLPADAWRIERAEQIARSVTAPSGEPAVLEDSLLVLRRITM